MYSVTRNRYFCTITEIPTYHFLMHSQDGYSPLHKACEKGYDGIVEKLLQAGATVDLQTEVSIAVAV